MVSSITRLDADAAFDDYIVDLDFHVNPMPDELVSYVDDVLAEKLSTEFGPTPVVDRDPGVRPADPRPPQRPRAGVCRRVGYSPNGHASLPARVRTMFVESQNSTSSPSSFSAWSSILT